MLTVNMARSIHTTKRDLVRERRFAAMDEVSDNNSITDLEANHLKKSVHKINEAWKREARQTKATVHAKIICKGPSIKRCIQKAPGHIPEIGAS